MGRKTPLYYVGKMKRSKKQRLLLTNKARACLKRSIELRKQNNANNEKLPGASTTSDEKVDLSFDNNGILGELVMNEKLELRRTYEVINQNNANKEDDPGTSTMTEENIDLSFDNNENNGISGELLMNERSELRIKNELLKQNNANIEELPGGSTKKSKNVDLSFENNGIFRELLMDEKSEPRSPTEDILRLDDNTIEANDYPMEVVPKTQLCVQGRRIIDYQFFFDQLVQISQHGETSECKLSHLKTIEEKRYGFASKFLLYCSMCEKTFSLNTCEEEENVMDINHAAVSGAIISGCDSSKLNEIASSMNLPTMNNNLYSRCNENLYNWWKSTAEHTMKEAAAEERSLTTEKTLTGIAKIPVILNENCCKRINKTICSSLSDVSAIIGVNSGKVLNIAISKIRDSEGQSNMNRKESSISVDQTAIIDAFKQSMNEYDLAYSKLLIEDDTSLCKNIIESRPYPNVIVEKIECTNSLLRNYNEKNLNLTKDTSIPIDERKLLNSDSLNSLEITIKSTVEYWKSQNIPLSVKITKLQNDILKSSMHVFGQHTSCESYFCSTEKRQDPNNVPGLKKLIQKLNANATRLAYHARSLLYNLNKNRAVEFNDIVAKYIKGKDINYEFENSFELRCYIAVVAFNTGKPIICKLNRPIFEDISSKSVKITEQEICTENNTILITKQITENQNTDTTDNNQIQQKPDMTPVDYKIAKELFFENLKQYVQCPQNFQEDTLIQVGTSLTLELRRCFIEASQFSKICKPWIKKKPAHLVNDMLYTISKIDKNIEHEKINKLTALKQLVKQENITIQECGMYFDDSYFFLNAAPDALFDEGIVEIMCPLAAYGMAADDAIKIKRIKLLTLKNGKQCVNYLNDRFYEIQGKLHITKKQICLLAIWTGPDKPLKVAKILRDDNFWEYKMKVKLLNFYYSSLLPEIIDSRKSRSMDIRNTEF